MSWNRREDHKQSRKYNSTNFEDTLWNNPVMQENLSLTTFSARNRASSLPSDSSTGALRRRVQTEPDSYEHFIEAEKKARATKASGQSILNRMCQWLKRNLSSKKENVSKDEKLTMTESATVDELQRKIDGLVEESMEREADANQARKELEKLWTVRVICLSTLENCTASCDVLISRARVLATGIENGMFHREDIEQRKDSFVDELETLKRNLSLIEGTLVQDGTQDHVSDNRNVCSKSFEADDVDSDHPVEDTDRYTRPFEEQLTSIGHSLSALTSRIQDSDTCAANHGGSSHSNKEQNAEPSFPNFQDTQIDLSIAVPPTVSQSYTRKAELVETKLATECEVDTKAKPQEQEFEEIKQKVEFILQQQSRVEQELKTLTQTQQEIAETTPAMLSSLQTQLSNLSTTLQASTKSAKPIRSYIQDYPSELPKFIKVLPTDGDCSDIGSKTPPLRDVILH